MIGDVPSRKKVPFEISKGLDSYLKKYGRNHSLPIQYQELHRFTSSIPLIDLHGRETMWETVFFEESDTKDLHEALTKIYAILKTDGDFSVMEHLSVARIDFCTFGNTKPFRVRIINKLNDNYDHFYIKVADASRIYGLELEHILSPNRITYLVDKDTLIEEHIAGIPGDDFMSYHMDITTFDKTRIAKEFVKFNERCFIRLLGDMRAYNFVIDITPDIEGNQYRIRAIDFDQQSYEGRKSFYMPQYFKENNPIIFLGIKHMAPEAVKQYQIEERSLIAARAKTSAHQLNMLLKKMVDDDLSFRAKVDQLKEELAYHHKSKIFDSCHTMGEIVLANLKLLLAKEFHGFRL
ncbi:hypothetical protein [Membranihabitans maritimus]|uniref:hypothetical protein n=1 Tax=Membranihabitans maritimus TaxID=2904244 RepID=UPI001F284A80|nr:hypothetical protein [Membranihabitans maritimus]